MPAFRTPSLLLTGRGTIEQIGSEAKKLGGSRILILTDKGIKAAGLADFVQGLLEGEGLAVEICAEVEPEPPIESFEHCLQVAREGQFDLFIGLGGGSSMDMAKSVSVMMTNPGSVQDYFGVDKVQQPGLPKIAVPTTAGTGSEVTPIAILTDTAKQLKIGVVSPYLIPDVSIVDPQMTETMPPHVTAATGMDALTHAIESYTSLKANPLTDALAIQAIILIARSLRTAVANGADQAAREDMALGSLLAGMSFANASVTATHALAFPLGGKFDLPHGVANGLMLPYVMEFNCVGNLVKFAHIARLLGERTEGLSLRQAAIQAAKSVRSLEKDIGVPQRLREVNVPEEAIPELAAGAFTVTRILQNNPRHMTLEDIEAIYRQAF